MQKIILCDLDGTLANIEHRLHLISGETKHWPSFYKSCINDKPIRQTIDIMRCLSSEFEVWITSGRSDVVRDETVGWLQRNGVWANRLIMREEHDHQPDYELKRSWLTSGLIPRERVLCAFDDRQRVVDMWRSEGIICYQVADGKY